MKKKTLVLEDSSDTVEYFQYRFGEYLEMNFTESAKRMVELLKSGEYEVVFLDYHVEDGCGLDVVEFLESHPEVQRKATFVPHTNSFKRQYEMWERLIATGRRAELTSIDRIDQEEAQEFCAAL